MDPPRSLMSAGSTKEMEDQRAEMTGQLEAQLSRWVAKETAKLVDLIATERVKLEQVVADKLSLKEAEKAEELSAMIDSEREQLNIAMKVTLSEIAAAEELKLNYAIETERARLVEAMQAKLDAQSLEREREGLRPHAHSPGGWGHGSPARHAAERRIPITGSMGRRMHMPEGLPSVSRNTSRRTRKSPAPANERRPPAEHEPARESKADEASSTAAALGPRLAEVPQDATVALRRAARKERSLAALSARAPDADERLQRRLRRREKQNTLSGAVHVVRMSRRMKDRVRADEGNDELSEWSDWSDSDESVDELLAMWHRPAVDSQAGNPPAHLLGHTPSRMSPATSDTLFLELPLTYRVASEPPRVITLNLRSPPLA